MGKEWRSLVEGDDTLVSVKFGECPSSTVSILLQFYKHNSLPLGPIQAFGYLSLSTKELLTLPMLNLW